MSDPRIVSALNAQADAYQKLGIPKKAEDILRQIHGVLALASGESDSRTIEARLRLAKFYDDSNQYAKACDHYGFIYTLQEKNRTTFPEWHKVGYLYSLDLYRGGDFSKAEAVLDEVILFAKNISITDGAFLGRCYRARGEVKLSRLDYKAAYSDFEDARACVESIGDPDKTLENIGTRITSLKSRFDNEEMAGRLVKLREAREAELLKQSAVATSGETVLWEEEPTLDEPLPPGALRVPSNGYIGALTKKGYDSLVGYVAQGDREAFYNALALEVAAGTCVRFRRGEVFFIEDTAVFSGLVKIRRKGETRSYWTGVEITLGK